MFTTLQVSLEVVRQLRPVVGELKKREGELADQLVRAASSCTLNLAEGAKRVGKDQHHHYRIASGSCAEVRAALSLGEAWGHLDGLNLEPLLALLDRLAALLHRLTHRRA